jgi:hypothetical protein
MSASDDALVFLEARRQATGLLLPERKARLVRRDAFNVQRTFRWRLVDVQHAQRLVRQLPEVEQRRDVGPADVGVAERKPLGFAGEFDSGHSSSLLG